MCGTTHRMGKMFVSNYYLSCYYIDSANYAIYIHKECYTVARRYQFYVRVTDTIYRFCHDNIKFIYLSQRGLFFFLIYGDQMSLALPILFHCFRIPNNPANFTNHRSFKKPSSFNEIEKARIVTSMSDMPLASVIRKRRHSVPG